MFRSCMKRGLANAVLAWDDAIGEPGCKENAVLVVKVSAVAWECFDADLPRGRAVVRLVGGRLRGCRDAVAYVRKAEELAALRASVVRRLQSRQFRPFVWDEGSRTERRGAPVACPR